MVGFAGAAEFSGYALNRHQRRDPKLTLPNAGIYIGGVTMPEWKNAWYGRTSRLYLSGFFLDVVKHMLTLLQKRYASFHQQILVADANAVAFYKSLGFERAGKTVSMWIYAGNDH